MLRAACNDFGSFFVSFAWLPLISIMWRIPGESAPPSALRGLTVLDWLCSSVGSAQHATTDNRRPINDIITFNFKETS